MKKIEKDIFYTTLYMNTNLLDLNYDILEITRGYVKKNNEHEIDKEYEFERTDFTLMN